MLESISQLTGSLVSEIRHAYEFIRVQLLFNKMLDEILDAVLPSLKRKGFFEKRLFLVKSAIDIVISLEKWPMVVNFHNLLDAHKRRFMQMVLGKKKLQQRLKSSVTKRKYFWDEFSEPSILKAMMESLIDTTILSDEEKKQAKWRLNQSVAKIFTDNR